MMLKRVFIIVVVLIVVLAAIIPWLATGPVKDYLVFSMNLLSSLCTLIMTIIAIILFNKYVIDPKLIDRQLDVVLKLIDEIDKIEFVITKKSSIGMFVMTVRFNDKNLLNHKMFGLDTPLYFSIDDVGLFHQISSLCKDPFMPLSIVKASESITFDFCTKIIHDYNECAIVKKPESKQPEYVGLFNDNQMTIEEFLSNIDNFKNEVKKWLQNNSSIKIEMNF